MNAQKNGASTPINNKMMKLIVPVSKLTTVFKPKYFEIDSSDGLRLSAESVAQEIVTFRL